MLSLSACCVLPCAVAVLSLLQKLAWTVSIDCSKLACCRWRYRFHALPSPLLTISRCLPGSHQVPVGARDVPWVATLDESFVMNRTSGQYFERVCYDTFVTVDKTRTVKVCGTTHKRAWWWYAAPGDTKYYRHDAQELAELLGAPVNIVQDAVSFYVRLGFMQIKAKATEVLLRPLHSYSAT